MDRNCKFFSPNYFNPTKCQNCFKPKEQHPEQEQNTSSGSTLQRKSSMSSRVNYFVLFANRQDFAYLGYSTVRIKLSQHAFF